MKTALTLAILVAVGGESISTLKQTKEPQKPGAFLTAKETLRNLKYVTVSVTGLDELRSRLSADILKTSIELKLRQNGLTVKQTSDDSGIAALFPSVSLGVNLLKLNGRDGYVYNIALDLERTVEIHGVDDSKFTYTTAVTWHKGMVGIVPGGDVDSQLRQTTEDLLAKFLNDFLEQNPKHEPSMP